MIDFVSRVFIAMLISIPVSVLVAANVMIIIVTPVDLVLDLRLPNLLMARWWYIVWYFVTFSMVYAVREGDGS